MKTISKKKLMEVAVKNAKKQGYKIIKESKELDTNEFLKMIKKLSSLDFRPFTKNDWMAFQGCESPDPLIAETEDGLIILDGNTMTIMFDDQNPDKFSPDEHEMYEFKRIA
jgi:hypothetical protein